MAELADARDLKSRDFGRVGSNPIPGTFGRDLDMGERQLGSSVSELGLYPLIFVGTADVEPAPSEDVAANVMAGVKPLHR